MNWRIHHKAETTSTNIDARIGSHGDVFTADYQTAGRGRLDHKWQSHRGENVLMSVVLDVGDIALEQAVTLPLVAGLAVVEALKWIAAEVSEDFSLKWPNDVLVGGRKIAGILCERRGDNVIVGIGINVGQRAFAPEIAERATSLVNLGVEDNNANLPRQVRDAVLERLGCWYEQWRVEGFECAHSAIDAIDFLKGRDVGVIQTDNDRAPLRGRCDGIAADGSLLVAGVNVYAGEAHIIL